MTQSKGKGKRASERLPVLPWQRSSFFSSPILLYIRRATDGLVRAYSSRPMAGTKIYPRARKSSARRLRRCVPNNVNKVVRLMLL